MGKVLLVKISLADIQSSGLFSPCLDPVSNQPQMILRTIIHFVECDRGLVVTFKKTKLTRNANEIIFR